MSKVSQDLLSKLRYACEGCGEPKLQDFTISGLMQDHSGQTRMSRHSINEEKGIGNEG